MHKYNEYIILNDYSIQSKSEKMTKLTSFLILSIFISTVLTLKDGVNTRITHNSTEILSRKKRFFALQTKQWRLRYIAFSFEKIIFFSRWIVYHINRTLNWLNFLELYSRLLCLLRTEMVVHCPLKFRSLTILILESKFYWYF